MSKLCLLMRADDRSTIWPETVATLLPSDPCENFEIVVVERGSARANLAARRNLRVLRRPQVGFDQPIADPIHVGPAEVICLDDFRDYHRAEDIDALEDQIAETCR